ncbi:MAG: transglutaminaseTgpA domain-containing protein [Myxococcota bacterium]
MNRLNPAFTVLRAQELLVALVSGLGFLALLLPGDLDLFWMGIALLGWPLGLTHLRHQGPSENTWRLLTLAFLVYALAVFWIGEANGLLVARQLLIFLQVNRLYVRKTTRDYTYILLLAFLQILLGCLLTISPLFAFLLAMYLLAGAWALALLELRRGVESQAHQVNADAHMPLRLEQAAPILRGRYLALSAFLSLLMLGLTLSIFLILPRLELGILQRSTGPSVRVAGFSEQVALGEVGEILAGQGRVMRVRVKGMTERLPPEPYWRGQALDTFDGASWHRSMKVSELYRSIITPFGGGPGGGVALGSTAFDRAGMPRGATLRQHYTVEPLEVGVMFTVPDVVGIQTSVRGVRRDYMDSFQTEVRHTRLDYVVYSRLDEPTPRALEGEGHAIDPRLAELYLQLPPMSPQVAALAASWTEGKSSTYQQIQAMMDHLQKDFRYTLSPQNEGDSPLEDFLFRTKAGHCEYFASALVVLARSRGIPARLVNGFLGGDYNALGDYFLVRQSDAHSWAEIWFEQSGWVRFDPTPSLGVMQNRPRGGGFISQLESYLDYFEMQWYFFVLDYDLSTQIELVLKFSSAAGAMTGSQEGWNMPQLENGSTPLNRMWWVLLALTVVVVLMVWRRLRLAKLPPPLRSGEGLQFFQLRARLELLLERRGLPRLPSETPLERAIRAEKVLGISACLVPVEEAYYAVLYGEQPLAPMAIVQVRAALERVKGLS